MQNWKEVQRLCTPFDQSGVYRRMVDFDANNVHGELAARSKQILSNYEIEKLRQTSPAGAMLYVWVSIYRRLALEFHVCQPGHKPKKCPKCC